LARRKTVLAKTVDRRRFLVGLAALAASPALVRQTLAGVGATAGAVEPPSPAELTSEDLATAGKVMGLEFTEDERAMMLEGVKGLREDYLRLRDVPLPNGVPPALTFDPTIGARAAVDPPGDRPPPSRRAPAASSALADDFDARDREAVAFLSVAQQGRLLRRGDLTSVDLTQLYLERLRRLGPRLECVVTLTEDRALEAARRADRELAEGLDRGPLHGIPWGAKDLLAVRGYPTTWGAMPFRDQRLDNDAAVVRRLDEAGAVLVAKLTLGALAWGDVWFGGTTRNPWNLEQGSSGSSAGSASATAAGLVSFALGSETWGSIVSPSTRCGTTGLRPTFGRVSREVAMTLSWSMDKLGPICRTVEDCALVFAAIEGSGGDPRAWVGDPALAEDRPFHWDPRREFRGLRVGYVPELFEDQAGAPENGEEETPNQAAQRREWRAFDRRTLEVLRSLGVELRPIQLPSLPVDALSFLLSAEAAAAFDELTRSGRDDELVRQEPVAWPNFFRQARLIPAVEYLLAQRVRTLLQRRMDQVLAEIDLYVAPSFGGDNLLLTNLTGHPQVVLPNGFREGDGTPTSITLVGRLFGEEKLLLLARAVQEATEFHRRRPPLI
jgi:Asp-tRNA(Asn)/Glu-tRNA(Gln) amidotransferase A subunit family amidase